MFALVDCNNFYVSCERVFQPNLEKKPVIVLSNNDGCVIARSNESKKLGIGMGVPFFEIKELVRKNQVQVYSSNFALYGDMSERVMTILKDSAPQVEIYSIDEAFLDFSSLPENRIQYAKKIVETIQTYTGLPVSIGIGPTKTLAKVANHFVKKWKPIPNIFDVSDPFVQDFILNSMDVSDIWGIGRRLKIKLNQLGIITAKQLKYAEPEKIRRKFNITVMQTVLELQGHSVIELETNPEPQKRLQISRSFAKKLTRFSDIKSALAYYIAIASEKLRSNALMTQSLMVFLESDAKFWAGTGTGPYNAIVLPLPMPTDDTTELLKHTLHGLTKIYQPGLLYKRGAVVLLELSSKDSTQYDFFGPNLSKQKERQHLMHTIDTINLKMGDSAIYHALEQMDNKWKMIPLKRSPAYTTRWGELPIIKAK